MTAAIAGVIDGYSRGAALLANWLRRETRQVRRERGAWDRVLCDLAAAIGVRESVIMGWCQVRSAPTRAQALALANCTSVPASSWFPGERLTIKAPQRILAEQAKRPRYNQDINAIVLALVTELPQTIAELHIALVVRHGIHIVRQPLSRRVMALVARGDLCRLHFFTRRQRNKINMLFAPAATVGEVDAAISAHRDRDARHLHAFARGNSNHGRGRRGDGAP